MQEQQARAQLQWEIRRNNILKKTEGWRLELPWEELKSKINSNHFTFSKFGPNPGIRIAEIFRRAVEAGINDPPLSLVPPLPYGKCRRKRIHPVKKKRVITSWAPMLPEERPLFELVDYAFKYELGEGAVLTIIREWTPEERADFLADAAGWCPDHIELPALQGDGNSKRNPSPPSRAS